MELESFAAVTALFPLPTKIGDRHRRSLCGLIFAAELLRND